MFIGNGIYYNGNYKELLESIKLSDEGIILTYLYDKGKRNIDDVFKEKEYSFDNFSKSGDGVMIYKKIK